MDISAVTHGMLSLSVMAALYSILSLNPHRFTLHLFNLLIAYQILTPLYQDLALKKTSNNF